MTAFVWQHSPANPGSLFLSGPRLPFYRYQLIPAPQLIQLFCSTDTGVINPHAGLQGGLMLKLKLQYFGHLMRRTDSLEKTLMLGKNESKRRRQQKMRWLEGITDSMDII